ncbi:MAG: response regulator [Comamonadaceae bacterium]|nr:MAG: response regulator [Comamonadaceae bacterium]
MSFLQGRSIRQKLNLILVVTTLLALLLAGVALVLFDLRNQARTIENDLTTQADIIGLASASALAFDDAKVAGENLTILRANPGIAAAVLYDRSGELFATFQPPERNATAPAARAPDPGVRFDGEWVVVVRSINSGREPIGTVYLQARHDLFSRVLDYLGALALILTSSLAAALLLSNRLQRVVTGPIVAVSEVARSILSGSNFSLRAQKTTDDEVGALVDGFNAMLDELNRRAQTLEQANQALRSSETRYQLAVRGSSAGLWDWDMAAGTMFYSPRFRQLLGYSSEEFPDTPASIVRAMHADDRPDARHALRAHLEEGKPYQIECRLRLKSGGWRWFFLAGMAHKDEAGKPFRMAGSVIDVTERKEAERTLQDANRAKDEFIATLAHELRNPLAPIRTGLEVLKRDRANGPASERARDTMERQLAHMVRLIDDLLDISRISSGKIRLETQHCGLRAIVENAVEISRPAIEAGLHTLAVDWPAQEIALSADPTRLAQSVGNLLNNAAKYTPPGGHIWLRLRREADCAVVEVQDDGSGIPPEMLENVFALFTQVGRTIDRSQGGLGIGLSLVRSLVELHHGTVRASSPGPGLGSTFTIRIPALPPERPQAAPPLSSTAPAPVPMAPRKVLVVDDNVDAAVTLATVLEMLGLQTQTVHAGPPVRDAALAFDPDVVLLDIGLPGMNGYDVARQLREEPRLNHTVLVALTGWGSEADRQRAQEAGFDHHLTKPVDFQLLEALLHSLDKDLPHEA